MIIFQLSEFLQLNKPTLNDLGFEDCSPTQLISDELILPILPSKLFWTNSFPKIMISRSEISSSMEWWKVWRIWYFRRDYLWTDRVNLYFTCITCLISNSVAWMTGKLLNPLTWQPAQSHTTPSFIWSSLGWTMHIQICTSRWTIIQSSIGTNGIDWKVERATFQKLSSTCSRRASNLFRTRCN